MAVPCSVWVLSPRDLGWFVFDLLLVLLGVAEVPGKNSAVQTGCPILAASFPQTRPVAPPHLPISSSGEGVSFWGGVSFSSPRQVVSGRGH